jgi:tetratricopeptide (TPR) repeat protein
MLGPNLWTKTHPKIAEAHRGQGLRNLRIQRWNDAIADLSEAIRLERRWAKRLGPQLADAYRGRGLDRTKDEEFKLAIVDLSEAVRLDPTNAKNYRARGLTYNRIGNWDLAAADLSRALEIDPGLDYELRRPLTEAQRNLGRVYAPVR